MVDEPFAGLSVPMKYSFGLNRDYALGLEKYFPVVGVFTNHLIDGSWYGENTDQRGISCRNYSGGKD